MSPDESEFKEECFLYLMTSPQRSRQRGHRSVCGLVCTTAVFAHGYFFKLSFGDIIYQTGLLLAQTAELRHTKSCVWLVYRLLVGICDRMSSLPILS